MAVEIVSVAYDVEATQGRLRILGPMSLSFKTNSWTTILGPSGCGKSTLLSLLAGFTTPTEGQVQANIPCRPAVCFQRDTVFDWMSVEKQLLEASHNLPHNEQEKMVDELLEAVGLKDYRHYMPKQLSGGMRKRVELARAWATKSEVVILDEPFSQLDTYLRIEVLASIEELWMREPRTVVMVTHDIEESLVGDRILILDGPPATIIEEIDLSKEGRPRAREFRFSAKAVDIRHHIFDLLRRKQ